MSLRYTEKVIDDMVCQFKIDRRLPGIVTVSPIFANMVKLRRSNTITHCIIDSNDTGILIIFLHPFKKDEMYGYTFINYSNIKKLIVKKGIFNITLMIRSIDGKKYRLVIQNRNTRKFPNHKNKITVFINNLSTKQLYIKDPIYQKHLVKDKISQFVYNSTLISMILMAIYLCRSYHIIVIILIIPITYVLHLFLSLFLVNSISRFINRKFIKEYLLVSRKFKKTNNASSYLFDLQHMLAKPKTSSFKSQYLLALSTAYCHLDRLAEAKQYLLELQTTGQYSPDIIKNQVLQIEQISNNKNK